MSVRTLSVKSTRKLEGGGERPPERVGVYFNHPGVAVVKWDAPTEAAHMEWQGWARTPEFQAANDALIHAITEHRGSRVLGDSRRMGVIQESDQDWVNRDWFPRILAAGLRRMALVLPESDLAKMNIDELVGRVPGSQLDVAYFATLGEARKWLTRPTATPPRRRENAASFLGNVLDASTEYSIIGEDLGGKIQLWNEGAHRHFGYGPEELIGKANASILNTIEDIAAGLPLRMLAVALETGKFEATLVCRRKDSTTFTARVVLTPRRDAKGVALGFLLIAKDISEEIRLNQELQEANAQLQEANRHKRAFLASMSHELRTPLNSILGFSELLIDSTAGQFSAETRLRFLGQIHSSGKHLLGLINDILDLSKVEAGQMELRLQVVSVAEIVSQVASIAEPLAAKKQIHLEFGATHAGEVVADEGKLKQMILNLVSNAIKFTPEGGSVTIAAARVGDRLEIVVSDDGIGVADEDIPRLFKEFQQIDSGANRTQQGTGLGLVLTRNIALLHGGDVRVESSLGNGSRFTIDIPVEGVNAVPRLPNSPTAKTIDDISRSVALIVEDDPTAADLLARQIERAGFRPKITHRPRRL